MSYRSIAVPAVAVLALQACAPKPLPPTVSPDLLNEGIAATCSYSPVQPTPGGTVQATITMTNDGWCAYRASQKQGTAYVLGLVLERPTNGELQIRKWNGETRVEYYPAAGFTGTDKFAVALRPSEGADARVDLAATVTRGAGVAAPQPEPEKPAPTRTNTRRRTTRTTH